MATVTVITGSPAWHADRAKGIGGSEAASLFNIGWGCERRLIMEKRGIEADYMRGPREEAVLERGNEMEDIVADKFERVTGLKVRRQPARVSKTHAHARVNMDRQIIGTDVNYLLSLTSDSETGISPIDPLIKALADIGPGLLECKTINEFDLKKLDREGFQKHEHYIMQEQHGLGVTNYKWGAFAFLEPTWWQFRWFVVVRNEALIEEIMRRVDAAWDVVEDTSLPLPPPLPNGDKRCKTCLHRKTCRGEAYLQEFAGADFESSYVVVEDPEMYELAADYLDAKQQSEQADEVVDAIKVRVKEKMEALGQPKVEVPNLIKFARIPVKGKSGWDGKALDGECGALQKGDEREQELAKRVLNCKKVGNPSEQFRTFAV